MGVIIDPYEISVWSTESTKSQSSNKTTKTLTYINSSIENETIPIVLNIPKSFSAIDNIKISNETTGVDYEINISQDFPNYYGGTYNSALHFLVKSYGIITLTWKNLPVSTWHDGKWRYYTGLKNTLDTSKRSGAYCGIKLPSSAEGIYSSADPIAGGGNNSNYRCFLAGGTSLGYVFIHEPYGTTWADNQKINIIYPLLNEEEKYLTTAKPSIAVSSGSNSLKAYYNTSNAISSFYIPSFLKEYKICTIGTNELNTEFRAVEPRFIENINGTHTLTFKMYYNINGEENPYVKYLFNEQRIKLKWKPNDVYALDAQENSVYSYTEGWYDLVIKNLVKDSADNSIVYTCKDLYENELSKTGYNLIFDNELQNSQGTVEELGNRALEGTEWGVENTDKIVQKMAEPVYEVELQARISNVVNQTEGTTASKIWPDGSSNHIILVYYSVIQKILNSKTTSGSADIQFAYDPDEYVTETNSQLLTQSICYSKKFNYSIEDSTITFKIGNTTYFTLDYLEDVSQNYRAERLVDKTITIYDPLMEKYVEVYRATTTPKDLVYKGTFSSNDEIYHYTATEFDTPQTVNNLFVNSESFLNVNGWSASDKSDDMITKLYPEYTGQGASYQASSYLKIPKAKITNSGLFQFLSFLENGIQKGDSFIFRYKGYYGDGKVPDLNRMVTGLTLDIIDNTVENSASYLACGKEKSADGWRECICTVKTSLSRKQLATGHFVFTFTPSSSFWLKEIQFYPLRYGYQAEYVNGQIVYEDGEMVTKKIRMNPGDCDFLNLSHIVHYFYNHTFSKSVKTKDDIKYIYKGENNTTDYETLQTYIEATTNDFNKIGTINISKSNRFNILQQIAQTFECWCVFNLYHNRSGHILRRRVSFVENVGEETGFGFEYGTDLRSVSRTIQSEQFTTKIIVPNNSNEFGENGFTSIARSELNYPKVNYILNFDYYVSHGFISDKTLTNDLYNENLGLGYYSKLNTLNTTYDEAAEQLAEYKQNLTEEESINSLATKDITSLDEQIQNIKNDLVFLARGTGYDEDIVKDYITKNKKEDFVSSRLNTISALQAERQTNEKIKITSQKSIDNLNKEIERLEALMEDVLDSIKKIDLEFEQKYSGFIREGTWQDESYYDDDKYYLDAQEVAYTSSRPQVSYNINVLRLSALEDFRAKVFRIGDIAYIQDIDFFGYQADGNTPYRELVVVSEITSYLDEPDKDTITVQNYRTQFEDLFQRITASVQSLQYSQGSYNRAAEALMTNGSLTDETIKKSFGEKVITYKTQNENIRQDATGITVSDINTPNLKSWLSPTGIKITEDGGINWRNVVTGHGLETDKLTAGTIYTDTIMIMDREQPSFRWNEEGITAYEPIGGPGGGHNQNKYTRFDYFGIYGVDRANGYRNVISRNFEDGLAYYKLVNGNYIKESATKPVNQIEYYLLSDLPLDTLGDFDNHAYYEQITGYDVYKETTDSTPVYGKVYYTVDTVSYEAEYITVAFEQGEDFTPGIIYYEQHEESGEITYVPTQDVTRDVSKTYYTRSAFDGSTNYYEYNELLSYYELTTDIEPVVDKEYYLFTYWNGGFGRYQWPFLYIKDGNNFNLLAEDSEYDSSKAYFEVTISSTMESAFEPGINYYELTNNGYVLTQDSYPNQDKTYAVQNDFSTQDIDELWEFASYGLTWKGFFLKSTTPEGSSDIGRIEISSDKDFRVLSKNNTDYIPRIIIGRIEDGAQETYGIRINNASGAPAMITSSNGDLWIRDKISIGDGVNAFMSFGYFDNTLIKATSTAESYEEAPGSTFEPGVTYYELNNGVYVVTTDSTRVSGKTYYIKVLTEHSFIVDADGTVRAKNGEFEGTIYAHDGVFEGELNAATGSFSGDISATSGHIGGFTIESDELYIDVPNSTTDVHLGNLIRYEEAYFNEGEDFAPGVTYYEKNGDEYQVTTDTSRNSQKTYYTRNEYVFISENFKIGQNGVIEAASAKITGEINAHSGSIGGFTIGNSKIYITDIDGIFELGRLENNLVFKAGTDNLLIDVNGNVTMKGEIIATNGSFTGNIEARTGSIGGFTITENALSIGNTYLGNLTEGEGLTRKDLVFNSNNNFKVYSDGYVVAENAKITGEVHAISGSFDGQITAGSGSIGGFIISESKLSTTGLELGNLEDGFVINSNDNFKVNSAGELFANAGVIGGFSITSHKLQTLDSGDPNKFLILDAEDYSIKGPTFGLYGDTGQAWFTNVEVSGKITSSVFVANTIQAVGGAMIFRPSFSISDFNKVENKSYQYNLIITDSIKSIGVEGDYINVGDYLIVSNLPSGVEVDNDQSAYEVYDFSIGNVLCYVLGKESIEYEEYYGSIFESGINYYELEDDIYVETEDLQPQSGKTYYIYDPKTILKVVAERVGDTVDPLTNPKTLVVFNNEEKTAVSINSGMTNVPGLIQAEGLTISNLTKEYDLINSTFNSNSNFIVKTFLGNLGGTTIQTPYDVYSNMSGYGLYSDNVYLKGALTAARPNYTPVEVTEGQSLEGQIYYEFNEDTGAYFVTSDTTAELNKQYYCIDELAPYVYAGINTSPNSTIIPTHGEFSEKLGYITFWGGAKGYLPEDVQEAPFFVTDTGNLYASSGYFTGTIITKSTITASEIRTARIYGTGHQGSGTDEIPGLILYNSQNMISFRNYTDSNGNPLDHWEEATSDHETEVFYIGLEGFYLHDKKNFININKVQNQEIYYVDFYGRNFEADSTIKIKGQLTDYMELSSDKISWVVPDGDDSKEASYVQYSEALQRLLMSYGTTNLILDDSSLEISKRTTENNSEDISNIYFGNSGEIGKGNLKFSRITESDSKLSGFDIYIV